ncbi:MAG: hypothetical protein HY553_15340, partial [Elusimicrobia bacterium]|nr:hypothetical protein [Elusimicrobiota bacterium]
NAGAEAGRVFIASATLVQSSDRSPVPGMTIAFNFQGTTITAVSNAVGLATVPFTAPLSSGNYAMNGSFAGEGAFNASYSTATVGVVPAESLLIAQDVNARASGVFTATATLSSYGVNLAGKSISFVFEGSTVAATTNASGRATAIFLAPASSGSYVYTASFAGDERYGAASMNGSVEVDAGGGSSAGSGGGTVGVYLVAVTTNGVRGQTFNAQAFLTELDTRNPIAGRSITFGFQGSTLSALTDSTGLARTTFTLPMVINTTYPFTAAFVGDSTYTAASTGAWVAVGYGLTPQDPMVKVTTIGAAGAQLTWGAITKAVDGSDISAVMREYVVDQAENPTDPWRYVATVAIASAPAYLVAPSTINVMYYRVRARTYDDRYSAGANIALVNKTLAQPTVVFLSDDNAAWVQLPPTAAQELQTPDAPDRRIVVQRQPASGFLGAYAVQVVANGVVDDNFRFVKSLAGFTLTISIDEIKRLAGIQALVDPRAAQILAAASPRAGSALVLYWWNGVEWMKLGGINDAGDGVANIQLRRPGLFAVRFDTLASQFNLTGVAPRVFAPNEPDDRIAKVRFTYENPTADEVSLRIFDRTGALVRSNGGREAANILFWDGRDDKGAVVKAGVYIYQLDVAGKSITGAVVVAK